MRSGDELRWGTTTDVGAKDFIGIVKIRHDQVEFGKVIHEIFFQRTVTCKKSSECPRFDGLDAIDQAAGERELDNVRVAQHFKVDLGKLPTQCSDRWQREDEITDGA